MDKQSFDICVEHDRTAIIASGYIDEDLEYLRKRINANRNLRNRILSPSAARSYESMKTLIDMIQAIYNLAHNIPGIIFTPRCTNVCIREGEKSYVSVEGCMDINVDKEGTEKTQHIQYIISASFNQNDSEHYRIECGLGDFCHDDVQWGYVYPVNANEILGYAENLPAPSVFAGNYYHHIEEYINRVGEDE